jgi:hypothetical protein
MSVHLYLNSGRIIDNRNFRAHNEQVMITCIQARGSVCGSSHGLPTQGPIPPVFPQSGNEILAFLESTFCCVFTYNVPPLTEHFHPKFWTPLLIDSSQISKLATVFLVRHVQMAPEKSHMATRTERHICYTVHSKLCSCVSALISII